MGAITQTSGSFTSDTSKEYIDGVKIEEGLITANKADWFSERRRRVIMISNVY
jgi:hypothetical protein